MYRVLGASNLLEGFSPIELDVISTPPTNCIELNSDAWKFFRIELEP